MRMRWSSDGIHLFDRNSGLNVLIDEVEVPEEQRSRAPRFASIALTNHCDLHCPFCYAPKISASLAFDDVVNWAYELDRHQCLGIGFGGGEPTLYPRFAELCDRVTRNTSLSVSFTTHGHRITNRLRDALADAVHFIRVSMDGVHDTYRTIRGRTFSSLLQQLQVIRDICPFGINFVVNASTVDDLSEAAQIASDYGATELLLLPEHPATASDSRVLQAMKRWIGDNAGVPIRCAISDTEIWEGIQLANPFRTEGGTRAFVHINAKGEVTRSSFEQSQVIKISSETDLLAAIKKLEK